MEMMLRLTNGLNYLITIKDEDLIDYFHYTATLELLFLSYFLINNSMWMKKIPEVFFCVYSNLRFLRRFVCFLSNWESFFFLRFLIKNLWFCRFIDLFCWLLWIFQQFCRNMNKTTKPYTHGNISCKLNFNICKKKILINLLNTSFSTPFTHKFLESKKNFQLKIEKKK